MVVGCGWCSSRSKCSGVCVCGRRADRCHHAKLNAGGVCNDDPAVSTKSAKFINKISWMKNINTNMNAVRDGKTANKWIHSTESHVCHFGDLVQRWCLHRVWWQNVTCSFSELCRFKLFQARLFMNVQRCRAWANGKTFPEKLKKENKKTEIDDYKYCKSNAIDATSCAHTPQ